MPIWFLPGLFVAGESHRLPDAHLDTTAFNVVHEFYPSTSRGYIFKKGSLEEKDRPYYVPTYGMIQSIKPDRRLVTYAFSSRLDLLEGFAEDQTFILGKRRTMFQTVGLSPIVEGVEKQGECTTNWLELPPNYGGRFQRFEVLAATMRYMILRGTTREEVSYVELSLSDGALCLPDFYLEQIPIGK